MSSNHQNSKTLTQSRPDSGYYDGESPMEVDGHNHRSPQVSRHNGNGDFGRFSTGNLNGSAASVRDSNGGGLVLTAGIGVRSPATRRRGGPRGISVSQVIRSGEGPVDTVSTTVVRPSSGGADGTSVRPNYSTRPGACDNFTDEVLGVITIGDVKDVKQSHRNQNGTAGQKEEISYGCAGNQKPHHLPDIVPQKPVIPDPPKPQAFPIVVKNGNNGKSLDFRVRGSDTVDSLLGKITKETDLNPDQFRLNYGGKVLTRGRTLGSCGVEENSKIFVEPYGLRGG